jgi:uncharacterized protein
MTHDKPSRNEDEYFAREEAERLRVMREQEAAARRAAERKSHRMKCPHCGADLHVEAFHGVNVDRCNECHGIWLEQGELEQLVKAEDQGVMRRVLTDVRASLHRLRAGA